MEKTIELDQYQQTAYWWIQIILAKVNELYKYKARVGKIKDKEEEKFFSIFEKYDDKDWRNVYINLQEYIKKDVENYIPTGDIMFPDCFSQDTAKGGHRKLNEELSHIVNKVVPDIRLACRGRKDYVIYTSQEKAYEWYKSCGIDELSSKYECNYNYVLTGDIGELDFYNLVLATCIFISEKRKDFNSTKILRDVFCNEYKKYYKIPNDINEIQAEFNKVFRAFSGRIDISRFYDEDYCYYYLKEMDKNGLDAYMELANEFALKILEEYDFQQNNKENVTFKKIMKNTSC